MLKRLTETQKRALSGLGGLSPEHLQAYRRIYAEWGYEVPPIVEPSLAQKAKNFTKAVTKHVIKGFRNVPEDVQKARYDTCKGCEHYNPEKDSCRLCGCKMSVKTGWAEQECPINLWTAWSKPSSPPEP